MFHLQGFRNLVGVGDDVGFGPGPAGFLNLQGQLRNAFLIVGHILEKQREAFVMNTITVQAHFDGKQIRLDEPLAMKPGTKLFVTIVLDEPVDEERQGWLRLAESSLNAAYGQDEIEYTLDLIKEPNPDYEGR